MNAKTVTNDFVSAYVKLLDSLHGNSEVLDAIKVNILCCQHNRFLEQNAQNENGFINMDDHCHQCLTPWKKGHFTMKTNPKCKNNKFKKKPRKFILVMKCLVCLRVTSSLFEKNKKLNKKFTKDKPKPIENLVKTPKIDKDQVNVNIKKPKKKKRNLYAGLNPLVFKNKNIFKKNKIKPVSNF